MDYDTLRSTLEDWLNREGFHSVTQHSAEFLAMAQRRITRLVRIPAMERVITLQVGSDGTAGVPAGYVGAKYVLADDGSAVWTMTRANFTEVKKYQISSVYGKPLVFDVEGDRFYIGDIPSGQDITLVYYKEVTPVSTDNSNNWFSDEAPELILFAALAEAAIFMKDPAIFELYETKFQVTKQELERLVSKNEHSGSPLSVRLSDT